MFGCFLPVWYCTALTIECTCVSYVLVRTYIGMYVCIHVCRGVEGGREGWSIYKEHERLVYLLAADGLLSVILRVPLDRYL